MAYPYCTCGFLVRDYNQKELVTLCQTHAKNTHNQNLAEKDVLSLAKTVRI